MPKLTRKRYKPRRFDPSALSPNQAAKILGITGEAVKQWIYKGLLPAVKLPNGYYRIKHDDLAEFLKKRQTVIPLLALAGDNKSLQEVMVKTAKDLNHNFIALSSTAAALKQFKVQAPYLLVVDLDAFKEGWKLIRRVRGSVRYGSARILLLSRNGLSEKETAEAIRLSVGGCLEGSDSLVSEVRRLLVART